MLVVGLVEPTASDDIPPPLEVDEVAWDDRDLLERIIEREYSTIDRISGPLPAWAINPVHDESDAVGRLNRTIDHLGGLDLTLRVRRKKRWSAIILPRPRPIGIIDNKWILLAWAVTAVSTLLMGINWLVENGHGTWSDRTLWLRSGLEYTAPILIVLGLSYAIQRTVMRMLDMPHSGSFPIPFPFPLASWPFGILTMVTFPRMESMVWSDRRRLALASLTIPCMLCVSGLFLVIIGVGMTPTSTSIVSSGPVVHFSASINLVLSSIIGAGDLGLRSAWLHPTALAGLWMILVGWVMLLPIPTFPGSRLLVALVGPDQANSRVNQFLRATLIIVVLILLFQPPSEQVDDVLPWILLAIAALMLNNSLGGDVSNPLLLDPDRNLNPRLKMRVSFALIGLLLLLLPAYAPVASSEDRSANVIFVDFDDVVADISPDIEGSNTLTLIQDGLTPSSWNLQAHQPTRVEGWLFTLVCPDSATSMLPNAECSGNNLLPGESIVVEIVWIAPPAENIGPIPSIDFRIDIGEWHTMRFLPATSAWTNGTGWTWNGNHISPVLELDIYLDSEFPLNLSIPLSGMELESTTSLIDGGTFMRQHTLIARGESGVLLRNVDNQGLSWVKLEGRFDNGQRLDWNLSVRVGQSNLIRWGDDHVLFFNDTSMSPSLPVNWNDSVTALRVVPTESMNGTLRCPGSVAQMKSNEGEIEWRAIPSAVLAMPLPADTNLSMRLFPLTTVLGCTEQNIQFAMAVVDGPTLLVNVSEHWTAAWDSLPIGDETAQNHTIQIRNFGEDSVRLTTLSYGGLQNSKGLGLWFEVPPPDLLEPGETVSLNLSFSGTENDRATAWLSALDGELIVHLASHLGEVV